MTFAGSFRTLECNWSHSGDKSILGSQMLPSLLVILDYYSHLLVVLLRSFCMYSFSLGRRLNRSSAALLSPLQFYYLLTGFPLTPFSFLFFFTPATGITITITQSKKYWEIYYIGIKFYEQF